MFRIWFTNVDTLTLDKNLELKPLIDSTPNPTDLIALSEANLKKSLIDWNPLWHNKQGYRLILTNMNPNDTGRGRLIHIRDGIDIQEQNNDSAVLENQIVDLKLGDVKKCLTSVYRSPNSTTEKNFRLNEKIRTLGKSDGQMIILGNFKYPKINWEEVSCHNEEDSREALFLEVVRDAYLTQCVKEHTRSRQTVNRRC